MVLDTVNVYKISIPFSREFSHSRSKKTSANNIVVEVVAEQGTIVGYGEGAPRHGVTGESQESAIDSIGLFIKSSTFPWQLNNVSQIWDFVDDLPEGKEYNSAICALEMALLDVLGKGQGRSVIDYFPQDFFENKVFYGAALTLEGKEKVKMNLSIDKDFYGLLQEIQLTIISGNTSLPELIEEKEQFLKDCTRLLGV